MKFRIYFDIDIGFRIKRKNGRWWSFHLFELCGHRLCLSLLTWQYEGDRHTGLLFLTIPTILMVFGKRWVSKDAQTIRGD